MNRSELAALFAANPPFPLPGPTSSSSSPVVGQGQDPDYRQNPVVSSPKSPRLAFQSRVQKVQQQRSPPRPSFNSHSRRHSELEHVSTLRVTHKRTCSARPLSQETPDFWAEEREAWGQRSPQCPQSPQPCIPFAEADATSNTRPKLLPVLSPPRSNTRPIPQPRKQSQGQVPLRIFEPSNTLADPDERPKTSRGPRGLDMLKEESEEAGEGDAGEMREDSEDDGSPRLPTSTNRAARTSKFFEGSMNERSFGIASSWFHEVQSDSDKPLPPTPATKHVTFSCTPVRESPEGRAEQTPRLATSNKRKARRGLRKSISNFNFQTLSEKIRIFGSLYHHDSDPTSPTDKEKEKEQEKEQEKEKPKSASRSHLRGADILSERKRKADEAYALQFGFKKARPAGPPTAPSSSSSTSTAGPLNTSTSSLSYPSSTSSSKSAHPPNLRKKKSRRELERENAELRARLDAQLDAHSLATTAPTTAAPAPAPAGTSTTAPRSMGGVDDQPSSRAQQRTGQHEDKARLAHPEEKKVLREVENGGGVSGTTPGKADEKAEGGSVVGVENAGLRRSFEWPEDVF
jgi:hypothetical protein